MELKEAKRLIRYAKNAGVRHIKWGELEVTFQDEIVIPMNGKKTAAPKIPEAALAALKNAEVKNTVPPALPTLDEINKYIYEDSGETH